MLAARTRAWFAKVRSRATSSKNCLAECFTQFQSSLCVLCVLCVSVVMNAKQKLTTEAQLSFSRITWSEEIIQPASEAGGKSASPRRWRSRAWGTEPKTRPSPRSGRQMQRAKKTGLKVFQYPYYHLSPASQALQNCWLLPQARLRHRLGLSLFPPASLAH